MATIIIGMDSNKNKDPKSTSKRALFLNTEKELTFFLHSSVNESPKQNQQLFSLLSPLSHIHIAIWLCSFLASWGFPTPPFIVLHLCCWEYGASFNAPPLKLSHHTQTQILKKYPTPISTTERASCKLHLINSNKGFVFCTRILHRLGAQRSYGYYDLHGHRHHINRHIVMGVWWTALVFSVSNYSSVILSVQETVLLRTGIKISSFERVIMSGSTLEMD